MGTRRRTPRSDAADRAGVRLAAAGAGLLALGLLVGPLALLVHGGWSPLVDLDGAVTRRAEDLLRDVPGLLGVAALLTHLGAPLVLTLVTAAGAAVLWRRGHGRLALYLLAARAGALLLSTSLKAAVGRARPVFEDPVASAFGQSFPSGHALGAAAFWPVAAVVVLPLVPVLRRRAVLAAAVVVPVVVAATRVLLGVHFLSDVVAGLVLGGGWAAVCTTLFALWRREEGRPVRPYEQGMAPELDR